MAQKKTGRRLPELKEAGERQQNLQSELDELDFIFDSSAQKHHPDTEDTNISLKVMIDELTDEAVENRTSPQISSREELIPLHKVEMIDDDDPDEEPRLSWLLVIAAVLALAALIACVLIFLNHNRQETPAEAPVETPAETADTEVIAETAEPVQEDADPADLRMNSLNEAVVSALNDAQGIWSVYVKDLGSGRSFVINDTQMSSASLIKLFTAGKYLEMVENGEIYETEDSAYSLMAMISWSDNTAWEAIETTIGYGDYVSGLMAVTEFAQRHGYIQSGRDIGAESVYDEGADNLTTAAEVGALLESIYNGSYVSPTASERIYGLMGMQSYINKIPAGLPEGFEYASKAGDLPGVENDSAIINGPDTDYILVVMSNDIYDSDAAVSKIVEISSLCARTLNPSIQQ